MVVYQIVQSHALPRFDPTKTVKDVLFSASNARVASRIIRQYARIISGSYFIGTLLFPMVMFAPASVAQYVAIMEMLMEIPACIMSLLTLRADLVKVLVTSYDYWFFVSATLVYTISFSLLVHDLRLVLIASRLIGFQLPILIDANVSKTKPMIVAVVINIALTMIALAAVSLEAMPGMIDMEANSPGSTKRSLSVRDLLANALMTMEILLLRIVIRKNSLINSTKVTTTPVKSEPSVTTMKCVTIRCLLKLHPVGPQTPSSVSGEPRGDSTHNVQLRHAASDLQYDSTDIVLPSVLKNSLSPQICMLLHSVGIIGVILTFACGGLMMILDQLSPSLLLTTISVGAAVATGSYLGVLTFFNNRQLLLSVCLSFDFLFLNLQVSFAHACVCDMFRWQLLPSATLACLWLWLHWVITLDTLTPHMKEHLRFSHSRQLVLAFLVMYLIGQIAFLVAGVFRETWELQNRTVISTNIFGKHLGFRVLPFFDDPSTLIMLRGQVEFDYEHSVRTSTVLQATSIMPAPMATSAKQWEPDFPTTSDSVPGNTLN